MSVELYRQDVFKKLDKEVALLGRKIVFDHRADHGTYALRTVVMELPGEELHVLQTDIEYTKYVNQQDYESDVRIIRLPFEALPPLMAHVIESLVTEKQKLQDELEWRM